MSINNRFWFGVLTAAATGEHSIVVYDRKYQSNGEVVRLYRLKNDTILELEKSDARRRIRGLKPEERSVVEYALSKYFAALAAKAAVERGLEVENYEEDEEWVKQSVTQCESCAGTGEDGFPGSVCLMCHGSAWLPWKVHQPEL